MYVNYGYYESKYLLGREPTVPEDDFLFWEKQTERILNQYTFGRLNADTGLLSDAFKVTASADNTKFPVAKHYRLGG